MTWRFSWLRQPKPRRHSGKRPKPPRVFPQLENLEPRLCMSGPPHGTDGGTVTVTGSSFSMYENASTNVTVATFTDSDGDPASNFSATIHWGDGTQSSGSISGSGTFSVSGTHSYSGTGSFSASVNVSDSDTTSGSASMTGTVSLPTAGFSSSTSSVSETAGNVVLTVTLNAAVNMTVSMNYATANGTGTAGTNYTSTSGTLTFPANTTSKTITVPITDGDVTSNKTFTVSLSSASNTNLGTSTSTVTITAATGSTYNPGTPVAYSSTGPFGGPLAPPPDDPYATIPAPKKGTKGGGNPEFTVPDPFLAASSSSLAPGGPGGTPGGPLFTSPGTPIIGPVPTGTTGGSPTGGPGSPTGGTGLTPPYSPITGPGIQFNPYGPGGPIWQGGDGPWEAITWGPPPYPYGSGGGGGGGSDGGGSFGYEYYYYYYIGQLEGILPPGSPNAGSNSTSNLSSTEIAQLSQLGALNPNFPPPTASMASSALCRPRFAVGNVRHRRHIHFQHP